MRISDWSSDVCSSDLIADRLRHLLAVDVEKAVVQPVARENLAAMRAGRLRDLVLVVRKDQVVTAAVNIDGLAKQRFGHRRALDMPAGATATPGRSEERRVGQACASTCRSRWTPYN